MATAARRAATIAIAITIAFAGIAYAQSPADDRLERIRKAYEQGDYASVRRELLAAHDEKPDPQLLFALGQVELNLGNYEAAIGFYERFIATNPSEEQIALAQQAIGAARMRLATPPVTEPVPAPPALPPPPAPERPHVPPRRWYREDTGFAALGTAAVLVGGGLLYYSHRLGNDTSGNLSEYDDRLEQARLTRWTGAGVAAAGAVVIGVTLLRWRLRPDGDGGADLTASIAPGAATFAFTGRW
jgi:tetratricopeptide (TPR) repeat protein